MKKEELFKKRRILIEQLEKLSDEIAYENALEEYLNNKDFFVDGLIGADKDLLKNLVEMAFFYGAEYMFKHLVK